MENLKYHYLNKKIVEVKMNTEVNLNEQVGIKILKDRGYNLKIEVDTTKTSITEFLKVLNPEHILDINISNVPLEDIISSIYKGNKKWENILQFLRWVYQKLLSLHMSCFLDL